MFDERFSSSHLQEYLQGNYVSVTCFLGEGEHRHWYVNSAVIYNQHTFNTFRMIHASSLNVNV